MISTDYHMIIKAKLSKVQITEAVLGESHPRPLPATPVFLLFHLSQKGEKQIILQQEIVKIEILSKRKVNMTPPQMHALGKLHQ